MQIGEFEYITSFVRNYMSSTVKPSLRDRLGLWADKKWYLGTGGPLAQVYYRNDLIVVSWGGRSLKRGDFGTGLMEQCLVIFQV